MLVLWQKHALLLLILAILLHHLLHYLLHLLYLPHFLAVLLLFRPNSLQLHLAPSKDAPAGCLQKT